MSLKGRQERVILALDVDAFYAQAETLRDPTLRGKAVGVRQKNVIITTTYEARKFGIEKGDSVAAVKAKCPEIIIRDGEDLSFYVSLSERWRDFVETYAEGCAVEKLGLDELFVDVSSVVEERPEPTGRTLGRPSERLLGGAAYCETLRLAVLSEIGLTTSGGVASTKVLAKLASSFDKPFAQTTVADDAVRLLLKDDTKATRVPGIGAAMGRELARRGVFTVGDCRRLSSSSSSSLSSSPLETARRLCFGDDGEAPVKPSSKSPKTVGVEESFWAAPLGVRDAEGALDSLVEKLARKLEALKPKLPKFADALIVGARSSQGRHTRTSRQRSGRYDVSALLQARTRLVALARDLLLDQIPNKGDRTLINLSLGLKFLPLESSNATATTTPRIDAFFMKEAAARNNNTKRPQYHAPSADDVDDDVLAALPADVRDDVERQRTLAEQAADHHPNKKPKAHFFQPQSGTGQDVATIVAMGFDEDRAKAALRRYPHGSIARAVDDLLRHGE